MYNSRVNRVPYAILHLRQAIFVFELTDQPFCNPQINFVATLQLNEHQNTCNLLSGNSQLPFRQPRATRISQTITLVTPPSSPILPTYIHDHHDGLIELCDMTLSFSVSPGSVDPRTHFRNYPSNVPPDGPPALEPLKFTRLKFDLSELANNTHHWIGRNVICQFKRVCTLKELCPKGFRVFKWDGTTPHVLLDRHDRIVIVLAGIPQDGSPFDFGKSTPKPTTTTSVPHDGGPFDFTKSTPKPTTTTSQTFCTPWKDVIAAVEKKMVAVRHQGIRSEAFNLLNRKHRRGDYFSLPCGVSFGGGQKKPMTLRQSTKTLLMVNELVNDPNVIEVTKFQSDSLAQYAPKIFKYQATTLTPLLLQDDCNDDNDDHQDNPKNNELIVNFSKSRYPAATFNLGPCAVAIMHVDRANGEGLLCAITAFGTFDHTLGGHLVLFDLGVAIEFPSGSTILIPSALLHHRNTSIQPGETRLLFTQYCAGGLLRWVKHRYRSDISYRRAFPKMWRKVLADIDDSPE